MLFLLVAVLTGFATFAQENATRTITVNGVTFRMKEVKGGRFNMGGTCEQYGCEDDEFPIHVVALDDYYIGETEVTQALWQAVMGDNPSGFTGDPNLPVERVWWLECQTFVNKLTELTGVSFRLPTESEWEFAARGGLYTHFYQYSGSDDLNEVGWYSGNSDGTTHPVAQLQPNELGLYDMTGNVFEWCQDYYGDYDMMPAEAPTGPEDGEVRVRRGGSWGGTTHGCRISFRISELENIRWNYIGLRLAATTIEKDVTSISNITEQKPQTPATRYNIKGQQVDSEYKGFVIEGGKKTIIP